MDENIFDFFFFNFKKWDHILVSELCMGYCGSAPSRDVSKDLQVNKHLSLTTYLTWGISNFPLKVRKELTYLILCYFFLILTLKNKLPFKRLYHQVQFIFS